jgi:hypothetical protein
MPGTSDTSDPDSKLVTFSYLILQIVPMVLGIIQTLYIDPENQKEGDALALAGVIVEWGLLLTIYIAICHASATVFSIFNDSVHLGNDGNLTLVGQKIQSLSVDGEIANSAVAGLNSPPQEESRKWYDKAKDFVKAHKAWFIGIGAVVGIGAAVGAGIHIEGKLDSQDDRVKQLQEELNKL